MTQDSLESAITELTKSFRTSPGPGWVGLRAELVRRGWSPTDMAAIVRWPEDSNEDRGFLLDRGGTLIRYAIRPKGKKGERGVLTTEWEEGSSDELEGMARLFENEIATARNLLDLREI